VLRQSRRETSPAQLGIPRIAIDSLIVQGTPSSGGSASGSAADERRWRVTICGSGSQSSSAAQVRGTPAC